MCLIKQWESRDLHRSIIKVEVFQFGTSAVANTIFEQAPKARQVWFQQGSAVFTRQTRNLPLPSSSVV
jgi:hypothetical protein